MKIISAIIIVLTLFSTVSFAADITGGTITIKKTAMPTSATGGQVSDMSGDVFVMHGTNVAHKAVKKESVASGTVISTGANSYAVLKFEDGQVVTMQANSTFKVREYRYDAKRVKNSNIVFSMFKGGFHFFPGIIDQKNAQAYRFRISTPNATIGIHGAEFEVVMVGGTIYSQVMTGKIEMTSDRGSIYLRAGQAAYVTSPNTPPTLVTASAIPASTFGLLLSIPPSTAPATSTALVPVTVSTPVPAAGGASISTGEAVADASILQYEKSPKASIAAAQASEFGGAYLIGKIGYNTSSPPTNHTVNQLYPGLEAGYGWDIGSVLLGVDGFADFHTNSITANDYGGDVKLGFPMGEFMPYAKLGETGGWPGIRNNFALGFEYKLDSLWSVASELFADSININGQTERNRNVSVGLKRSLP